MSWPTKGLRRASVNSFGFGGTNSHVVLDDAHHFLEQHGLSGRHCTTISPPDDLTSLSPTQNLFDSNSIPTNRQITTPCLFVWSVADEGGSQRLRLTYQSYLSTISRSSINKCGFLRALASTLCERRSLLDWRFFATASTIEELIQGLRNSTASIKPRRSPKLGFVFTGQGAQWQNMGKDLLIYPIFRRSLSDAEVFLQTLGCQHHFIGKLVFFFFTTDHCLYASSISRLHR